MRIHPFEKRPHRTLLTLSVPVLFSLIAEPLTGLVDTAFVARLGSTSLAALGVGTIATSAVFWIFNFLGVATQTEVANADGRADKRARSEHAGLASTIAILLGFAAFALLTPLTSIVTGLLGASGDIQADADLYTRIRWFGAPAVFLTVAGFGALRGIQDMKSPLWIAALVHGINIPLDFLLIFGFGPIPAMGIKGAAVASVVAQWTAAIITGWVLYRKLDARPNLHLERAAKLFRTGGDLFVRTGMLTLFLLVATRQATRIGADAGAAHQAIRQFWIFTALFLDAYALSGQSLVAYFLGSRDRTRVMRVAEVVCLWSFATGGALSIAMWIGMDFFASLLVPAAARAVFAAPWWIALLAQPLNALAFATDGIHWGTGDFRYLRNATSMATILGIAVLLVVDSSSLLFVWIVTAGWILIRAAFGMLRIWPGTEWAPLGRAGRRSGFR